MISAPSRANDSAMANARLHLFATPAMTAVFPSSSFDMNLIEYLGEPLLSGAGLTSRLSAEKERNFDQQNNHHDHLKEKSPAAIESVDHELIEFARGLQLLIHQTAVIGHTDPRRREMVHAGIEYIA